MDLSRPVPSSCSGEIIPRCRSQAPVDKLEFKNSVCQVSLFLSAALDGLIVVLFSEIRAVQVLDSGLDSQPPAAVNARGIPINEAMNRGKSINHQVCW